MHASNLENGFYHRRSSCLLPQCMFIDPYDKLPQMPFRLTVLKLDGSSFGIEVPKIGTVRDVKQAVEQSFRPLPKNEPGTGTCVGLFCLCFDGMKLLKDSDCIGMFGINDGDQLQFIRHDSSTYNLVRTKSEKEDVDLDNELSLLNGQREEPQYDEKNHYHRIDIEYNLDDCHTMLENRAFSKRQSSSSHLFRCWFPYRKLSRSEMRTEKRSSSLKVPYSNSGSFRNVFRFYYSTTNSLRETWKGKYGLI